MDAARRAAALAICEMHRGGYANLVAKKALEAPGLSERDRAFAGAVFYGTAERIVTLDYLLAPFLKRPGEKLDVEVRAILETGLYQMQYMRVPHSAAVNESVKLVKAFGKSSAAGLVNAVLRKAGGAKPADAAFSSELERVGVTYSVGEAVAKAVMGALPEEYEDFLAASFAKKETCLRVNTLRTTAGELAALFAQRGAETRAGFLPGCLYAQMPGGVTRDALFKNGFYHVQGEASQYACHQLAPQKGERVLDLCSAPGGKSATLAEMMTTGTGLTSCDIHQNRLALVEETFARLGIDGAELVCRDAAAYDPALEGQDRVLCDVPCSGLGVLGSKADLRYTKGENFAALPQLQLKILRTGARYVKKGGRLVYSTCTVRRQENQEVVRAFLREAEGFCLVKAENAPPGSAISEEMVTILPNRTGLDGFFVACLERMW